jgi:hypothetical protein
MTPLASGYVGRRPLNDEITASNSKGAESSASRGLHQPQPAPRDICPVREHGDGRPVPLHEGVMSGASTQAGRLRIRTGGRKNNADDYGITNGFKVDISVTHIRMMRIDENIPATHPLCATVAPILHKQMYANPVDRGTTLNRSGAAA